MLSGLTVLLALIGAIYAYLLYELGSNSVHAALKLLFTGCVTFERVTWKPCTLHGLVVRQPASLGRAVVLTVESIKFQNVGRLSFVLRFSKPRLNLLGNEEGLLHLVALLQEVGYLQESKAREHPEALTKPSGGSSQPEQAKEPRSHITAFQGEAHVSVAHLFFREGELELPYDVGQVIGNFVKVTAASGKANVTRIRKKLERGRDATNTPSSGLLTGAGRLRYPVLLHLKSEIVDTQMSGWRTDTGFRLENPIQSAVHFTPQIAQLALSKLHPLLGYAVSLQGRDEISASISPVDSHLPCEMVSLRLEPMKVVLQTKALVKSLVKLLNTVGKMEWQEPCTLEAWASSIAADIYRSGLIVSKRLDILLGHNVGGGKGIHLSMWGKVDAGSNATEMVLGIPAHTLRRFGARQIHEDFVYQIKVGGTAQSPEIDWLRAAKDLAEIVLKSRIQRGLPFMEKVFRRSEDKFAAKNPAAVPPPTLPFPWEAFKTDVDVDNDDVMVQHNPDHKL